MSEGKVDHLDRAKNAANTIGLTSPDVLVALNTGGILDALIALVEEVRGLNQRLDEMSRSDGKGGAWLRTGD